MRTKNAMGCRHKSQRQPPFNFLDLWDFCPPCGIGQPRFPSPSIHFFLCFSAFSRLSAITRVPDGAPATALANRLASFPLSSFFFFCFIPPPPSSRQFA